MTMTYNSKAGAPKTASIEMHQNALLRILKEFDRVCRRLDIPYILFAGTMLGAVRHQGFVPWDDDVDVLMLRSDYERFLREAERELDCENFYLQKGFSEHWPMWFTKLRMNGTACIEKYHPKDPECHQGIYMDIFPCDPALDSTIGRKLQFLASKVMIAKSLDRRGYDTDSRAKKIFMAACRLVPMKLVCTITSMGKADSEMVHSFLGGGRGYGKNIIPRTWLSQRTEAVFAGNPYPISAHYDEFLRLLYGEYMQLPPPEQQAIKQHAILVDLENSYECYHDYRDGMKFDVYTRSIR